MFIPFSFYVGSVHGIRAAGMPIDFVKKKWRQFEIRQALLVSVTAR